MKNLLAIGITGTLLYLGFKAFGLNRFNVYSVVRTLNPRITKVTLTGLSLATDISIDNPTNTSLKVSKPVVTITTGGKFAASSVPRTFAKNRNQSPSRGSRGELEKRLHMLPKEIQEGLARISTSFYGGS